jgi:maleate isomerase
VATPYDEEVTGGLAAFLAEGGHPLARYACLEMRRDIWTVPHDVTARLVRQADSPAAEAIVVSCTNLHTYDLIAPLEAELGKPVVTANQASMWAIMAALGRHAVGPGQRLVDSGTPVYATGPEASFEATG